MTFVDNTSLISERISVKKKKINSTIVNKFTNNR